MAHADYDCCAICDSKLRYVGFTDAKTKEEICSSCLVKLRDMGLHIITVDELIEWINKTPKDSVIEILRKLDFRACYYANKVDNAVEKKGIKFDENRYILDENEIKQKGYVMK